MTEQDVDVATDSSSEASAPSGSGLRNRWPLGLLTLIVVSVIAIGVGLLGDGSSADAPDFAASADAAPDFAIELIGGEEFRLRRHLVDDGRPVVLNLWASWCTPCRVEMPHFDTVAGIHRDVYFLGVAVEDDPDAARAFAEEVGVSYDLAIDEAERVGDRYPSPGLPATFFIAQDGTLARTVFGQLDEEAIDQLIEETFGL